MSSWQSLQERSFLESSARQRAIGLVDAAVFSELVGPLERFCQPAPADTRRGDRVRRRHRHRRRPARQASGDRHLQEGRFIGGSVGEVGGAKMVGALKLALSIYDGLQQGSAPKPKRAGRSS